MASDNLHVVFSADDFMAMQLATAACSVVRSTDGPVVVHVIDVGIRPRSFRRIEASLANHGATVHRLVPDFDRLAAAAARTGSRYPLAAFARILLPELLPELDRVVYLDCDLVVCHDVRELDRLDFDGALAVAVRDSDGDGLIERISRYDGRAMGTPAGAAAVNTGVMVIDLAGWREAGVTDAAIELMHRFPGSFMLADQDVLNVVLAGRVRLAAPQWNVYTTVLERPCGLSPADHELVLNDAWIIHYTLQPKPWHRGCAHPWRERFITAIDETVWSGWRPTPVRTTRDEIRRAARRGGAELKHRSQARRASSRGEPDAGPTRDAA